MPNINLNYCSIFPEGILPDQMPFICDPDAILSTKERGKLNGELVELAKRIEAENENGGEECGWGIYLGIAIVNQQFYNHFQVNLIQ